MTDAQIKYYGREWGAVCHFNDWRMDRGRLVPQARLPQGPTLCEGDKVAAEVVALGEKHASQNSRALTVEDLRRACIGKITGKFSSAKDLTNAQFDRLLILFKILKDPDNLDAIIEWSDPSLGEQKRLIRFIKNAAPEAYTLSIVKDRWGTIFWEDFETSHLKQLAATLAARNRSRNKRGAIHPGSNVAQENCPF